MVHELKSQDAEKSSGLWMICTIVGRELKALDVMYNSKLWMI